jgi:glutathione synthase/RimK-type ligase-like ATP-grasp enzyme
VVTPRIGLVGPGTSPTLRRLAAALAGHGQETLLLDLAAFPGELTLTLAEGAAFADGHDLTRVTAWYLDTVTRMSPVPGWAPPAAEWPSLRTTYHQEARRRQEIRAVGASLLQSLAAHRPMLPPLALHRRCWLQPALLRRLARAGLPVAPFVSGNDLEGIARFVDRWEERCAGRGTDERATAEQPCTLAWLKVHHLDLDRRPLLVRAQRAAATRALAVVIQGEGVSLVPFPGENQEIDGPLVQNVLALAARVAAVAGTTVAGVELELVPGSDEPWILGLDPAPDLADLEDRTGASLIDRLAAELVASGATAGSTDTGTAGSTGTGTAAPRLPTGRPRGPRRRIGLAGRLNDLELGVLAQKLREREAEPVPVELPLFPDRRAVHEAEAAVRLAREELTTLDALFLRTTGYSSPLPGPEDPPLPPARWLSLYPAAAALPRDQGACFDFKYALLERLEEEGVPVLNPPRAQEIHRVKPYQLFMLQAAGLPVPPTLTTSDPEAATRFVERQGGPAAVVVKPLAGIDKTTRLADHGAAGLTLLLARGPLTLQRLIHGETVRAYLVGERLVGAARILHSARFVDSSLEQEGAEPLDLPAAAADAARRACRLFGLAWTGVDFIQDRRTGELFLLELNASPMFVTFSRLTGIDVAGALAELLLGRA